MITDYIDRKFVLFFETEQGNTYSDKITQKNDKLLLAQRQIITLGEHMDYSESNKRQPQLTQLREEYENAKLQYKTLLKERDDIIAEILKLI